MNIFNHVKLQIWKKKRGFALWVYVLIQSLFFTHDMLYKWFSIKMSEEEGHLMASNDKTCSTFLL